MIIGLMEGKLDEGWEDGRGKGGGEELGDGRAVFVRCRLAQTPLEFSIAFE